MGSSEMGSITRMLFAGLGLTSVSLRYGLQCGRAVPSELEGYTGSQVGCTGTYRLTVDAQAWPLRLGSQSLIRREQSRLPTRIAAREIVSSCALVKVDATRSAHSS